MSIEEFTRTLDADIDGTGPYTVNHAYLSAEELRVTAHSPDDDTVVTLASNLFTLSPTSSDVNGNLTLDAATATTYDGWSLRIERETNIQLGWQPVQTQREKALEAVLRRLTLGLQDVAYEMRYAVRLGQDGYTIAPALATPAERANRPLVFDAAGTGLTVGPSVAELSEAVAAAATAVAARIAAEAAETAAETAAAAALASAQAAAASADASAASEDAAALSAQTANTAATQLLQAALAVGAQLFVDTTAGIAGTPDGGMFMVAEAAGVRTYQRSGSSAVPGRYLTRPAFASIADLSASGIGLAGEMRFVTGKAGGVFEWSGSNLSNQVSWDFQMGIWVPPSIALSGSGGAWVRKLDGHLNPFMFGATGGGTADDTEAIVCMDNVFRELSPTYSVRFTSNHMTHVGMGELNITHTYATQAEADAALAGLDDHSVVYVTADKKRWRVKNGAFQKMSTKSMNKKVLEADGLNANGLVLGAGAHAKQRLFAASMQQGGLYRVRFNGNHPSLQWGDDEAAILAQQVNPDTEELVFVEGYGYHIQDVTVRFSGGNGMRLRGIIGAVELSGKTVCQYCIGRGLIIDQMAGFTADSIWTEGCDGGGTLLDYDVTIASSTSQAYWKTSAIEIRHIYDENAVAEPCVEIKGGHFGPRIGQITKQGTGVRPDIKLSDSAGADTFWTGCQGGYFGLGAQVGVWIECDANSKNNVFKRQSGLRTTVQNDVWDFRDLGTGNVVEWDALDDAAFNPDQASLGDVSINGGSSNFINNSGASAQLVNTPGGMLGPIHDYHSNFTTGPGHVVASGFNNLNGGTEINFTLSINAAIPATVKQWYAIILGQFEAHQRVAIAVRNDTGTAYYNWDSQTWTALGSPDVFGVYRVLRADRRHRAYALPVLNDGTARTARINVRLLGGGEAKLYHGWFTDHPTPALTAIRSGQCLGTPDHPVITTALRPAATAVPEGTTVFNKTVPAVQVSDGTNWLSAALT